MRCLSFCSMLCWRASPKQMRRLFITFLPTLKAWVTNYLLCALRPAAFQSGHTADSNKAAALLVSECAQQCSI